MNYERLKDFHFFKVSLALVIIYVISDVNIPFLGKCKTHNDEKSIMRKTLEQALNEVFSDIVKTDCLITN